MAVGIEIETTAGDVFSIENLTTYSITENASSPTLADTSGGAITVQTGIQDFDGATALDGATLSLLEDDELLVKGQIGSPGSDGSVVSLTSMSAIARLNVTRQIAPFNGTLAAYLTALFTASGLPAGTLVVDPDNPSIGTQTVVVSGFDDNVLTRVKEVCAVYHADLTDKGDSILLRTPRSRTAVLENASQVGWASDSSQLAQSIEVYMYENSYQANGLVYPPSSYDDSTGTTTPAGWTSDAEIIQVDAFGTTVVEVPIGASLLSVQQPVCKTMVGPHDNTASVYAVMGKDSVETLDPAVWTAKGGSVSVKIKEDTQTLVITVSAGNNEPSLAPFRLAMSSGNDYSSLRIVGTGVFQNKHKLTFPTGVPDSMTTTEVGVTIDSIYVGTLSQAYDVAAAALSRYSSPVKTATMSAAEAGLDVGDIAGARMEGDGCMMRVTSAVTGPGGVQITAQHDTTFTDHDEAWAGKKFADWDAVWADGTKTWLDYAAAPLTLS